MSFTHFNDDGYAKMVSIDDKPVTKRMAKASCIVKLNSKTYDLITSYKIQKGDVLGVAQIAGIQGAKITSNIIPMCHPINTITGIDIKFILHPNNFSIEIISYVTCQGQTGVEMEALTAVSTAALTIYDMCKAVQKNIEITDIKLLYKTGGTHGEYKYK